MFRACVALCVVALLGGCAQHPQKRLATFDPAEYAPYAGSGPCSISGQAFLKTQAGDVKFGAGEEVFLNPVTAYSTEWYQRIVCRNEILEAADPRCAEYCRRRIADADGRFRFDGLPPGDYYVACRIVWAYGYSSGVYQRTGGYAGAVVHVDASRPSVDVVVSRPKP